jgi:hypothetical protein
MGKGKSASAFSDIAFALVTKQATTDVTFWHNFFLKSMLQNASHTLHRSNGFIS